MRELDRWVRRWAEERPGPQHTPDDTRRVVHAVKHAKANAPQRINPAWWLTPAAAAAALALTAILLRPAPTPSSLPAPGRTTVTLAVPCTQPRHVIAGHADPVLVKLDDYAGLFDRPDAEREATL